MENNIPLVTSSSTNNNLNEQNPGNSPILSESQNVPHESCFDDSHIQLLISIEETKLSEEKNNEELLDNHQLQC